MLANVLKLEAIGRANYLPSYGGRAEAETQGRCHRKRPNECPLAQDRCAATSVLHVVAIPFYDEDEHRIFGLGG